MLLLSWGSWLGNPAADVCLASCAAPAAEGDIGTDYGLGENESVLTGEQKAMAATLLELGQVNQSPCARRARLHVYLYVIGG